MWLSKAVLLQARVEEREQWRSVSPWFASQGGLVVVDTSLLFRGRVVVPAVGRSATLANLHREHQGQTNMLARAQESVLWPGLSKDIAASQATCPECTQEAAFQPRDPPEPIQEPDYPFQKLCTDYFKVRGGQYLVVVDR